MSKVEIGGLDLRLCSYVDESGELSGPQLAWASIAPAAALKPLAPLERRTYCLSASCQGTGFE